jgi:hypothetical protein
MLVRVPSPFATEDDPVAVAQPRYAWERWLGFGVVVLCVGFVLWQLNTGFAPWRLELGALFSDTTTNGGDMGAHVWWPAFLREHWFGLGRLSGWAPDWYAGFPVGQFYFPLPAVLVALADVILPYNIAFKLVTVSGAALLPIGAAVFARGLRFPWPAPPLFALATVRYLFEVRSIDSDNTWTIWGGNLAGLLAGEFSYTLALALALLFLGTLARSLDTGRHLWLPAVLLAATVLSHIVVAVFAVVGALLVWLVRRPLRTWRVATPIGVVGALLTAVWTVPLLVTQSYTASMRYEKLTDYAETLLRLPQWLWFLCFVAVVAGGWWRRTSTLVLVGMAATFALLFRYWPEHHVWNTRFLPLYYLCVALLGATGLVELIRHMSAGAVWVVDWVRAGDEAERAADGDAFTYFDGPAVDAEWSADGAERVERWEPSEHVDPPGVERRRSIVLAGMTLALVAAVVTGTLWWVDENPGVGRSWAAWNYRGYETKPAWPEYSNLVATMDELGRDAPGRALWEPSDDLNAYGTTLALELLPYWTDGRIGSMEGLYFESAATTPYHFLTVSELAADGNPSNPVRGLLYGTIRDFDLGVRHMQMLGVRYYLAQSDVAKRRADAHPDLDLVAEVGDTDGQKPSGWKIYEVADSPLVAGLPFEPVVASAEAGTTSECFRSALPSVGRDPELSAWECAAAPWWRNERTLDTPFAADGPAGWERVDLADLEDVASRPRERLPDVTVSDVSETPEEISFRVDRTGVPVLVKASYFPNWTASGAEGPYRIAPNLMVVVPTEDEVTLTYSTTAAEWLGRVLTVLGLVGVVLLARWRPRPEWLALARTPDAEAPPRAEDRRDVEAAVDSDAEERTAPALR